MPSDSAPIRLACWRRCASRPSRSAAARRLRRHAQRHGTGSAPRGRSPSASPARRRSRSSIVGFGGGAQPAASSRATSSSPPRSPRRRRGARSSCPGPRCSAAALRRRRGLPATASVTGRRRRPQRRARADRAAALAPSWRGRRRHGVGVAGRTAAGDEPTRIAVVRVRASTRPATSSSRPAERCATALSPTSALRRIAPVLDTWAAAAAAPRDVCSPHPRSFCAGVERAIAIVERALERYGAPVYVRRQIVHNPHVVRRPRGRGRGLRARSSTRCPSGAVTCSPPTAWRRASATTADRRGLRVIDATCPLVAKVHAEARRFADARLRHRARSVTPTTRRSTARVARRRSRIHVIDDARRRRRARRAGPGPGRLPHPDHARRRRDGGRRSSRFATASRPSSAARRRHLLRHPEPPGGGARARRPTST